VTYPEGHSFETVSPTIPVTPSHLLASAGTPPRRQLAVLSAFLRTLVTGQRNRYRWLAATFLALCGRFSTIFVRLDHIMRDMHNGRTAGGSHQATTK
jgi:hypothetical protein